jgi:NADH dehydrogenase (ubiquinone) Fe-S protein 2
MLLRSFARSTRTSAASRQLLRNISSSASLFQAGLETPAKSVFDYHAVEDLHGMNAAEILAEQTRADSKMRHFTGESCCPGLQEGILDMGLVQSILGQDSASVVALFLLTEDLSPQHPAAHGVLRMILELNGEEIIRADPVCYL